MKKTIIILIAGLIVLSAGAFYYFNNQKSDQTQEQTILEQTLSFSKEYASLRYQTDNVLINVKDYSDYDAWNNEMTDIINRWNKLEKDATTLEKAASEMAEEKVGFVFINQAMAYTNEEVTNVFQKAPVGKKIMTLANHLGVDAKMAQLILNETQNMISREAYGEEGDVMATCEQGAMRVKNGAKVIVFVGTVVATGGTSALAASGALAQTAVVVSGADLVLEVTDDEARIALGDKNKVSNMVSKIRTVTEPAAGILAVANIPGNLSKAIDRFSAVSLGADQIRSVAQDEKILGISIKIDEKGEIKTEISGLTEEELSQWKEKNNAPDSTQSAEEIIEQFAQISAAPSKEEKVEREKVEEKAVEKNNLMGINEFNQLSEDEKFKTMKQVRDFFGEPDFSTTNEAGRIVYIYLDRIQDGLRSGVRFTFYTLDDYKKVAESAFGWDEDYQDIWDDSEGGLVALEEIKNNEYFQTLYGL